MLMRGVVGATNSAAWELATDFMPSADEFLVLYALSCEGPLARVSLFCIGHAVELYLKAVYTYQTGDKRKAIDYRHNIKSLLKACKNNDSDFMKNFDFGPPSHPKVMHEFQFVADHLADLKYIGATKGSIKSYAYIGHNDYWLEFVREIRKYLNYPGKQTDFIREFLDMYNCAHKPSALQFLERLYQE